MPINETDRRLFQGQKFYLTRTLSHDVARELQELIEKHGGVVSVSPANATQLVDHDKLDSRRREWISIDYIKDSVDSGALQDPAQYSGLLFESPPMQQMLGGRVVYSVEDDARMLHFAKLRDWKSMQPMPPSAWKLAENSGLTAHSWQSMHEHFKKELRRKTPKEQRAIMAKASY
ncbi:hypothetical protein PHMEG_00013506 [Phytophthora megakarya]|uniref:Telomeric repeat-binding factor 2-interacting protein 1 n=1 Tax=Phytophthora megakarya TaxID=4795 RepID=A0A225W878_9STRA|nr:hypothetical protein PHMEG_00013506 [Phytophthora megakarya]